MSDEDSGSLFSRFVDRIGEALAWHRLPKVLGLARLAQIRNALRENNLHGTEDPSLKRDSDPSAAPEEAVRHRAFDGTYNDLRCPAMGKQGARFGRNFPLERVYPDTENLMSPSPRMVSRRLMTRDTFKPAEILNLLAAAWVQFQVHDWFAHKDGDESQSYEVPIENDDPWGHGPMRVKPTGAEPPSEGMPPTYPNENTHWWDASQVYGNSAEKAWKLRAGFDGKMKIGDSALLPEGEEGVELTGFRDNWWVGLSMLHALFVAEHNAICDRLKLEHPDWNDEQLFQQGRLINSALIAKIHTVEWTPAILPHPTVQEALNINWEGVVGEDLQEVFRFLNDNDILGGIVGNTADHHGTAYSLTEEFVAVYRMHPLMPDEFRFHSIQTGRPLGTETLPDVSLENTRTVMEKYDLRDLFYSFGIEHPGALRLHNYPRHLQELWLPSEKKHIDLASIDILRDRERGVPRYNEFRELLRMDRVSSFEELTGGDRKLAAEIEEVYGGDLDKVDLMVGMFAEPLIEGFGFSETAFRIFILMASRRLKSDRFFTDDFTEERYTRAGLQWIRDNSMVTVLLRHFPRLRPALRGVDNAFQPWTRTSRPRAE